jgi:hypothetical protein
VGLEAVRPPECERLQQGDPMSGSQRAVAKSCVWKCWRQLTGPSIDRGIVHRDLKPLKRLPDASDSAVKLARFPGLAANHRPDETICSRTPDLTARAS